MTIFSADSIGFAKALFGELEWGIQFWKKIQILPNVQGK